MVLDLNKSFIQKCLYFYCTDALLTLGVWSSSGKSAPLWTQSLWVRILAAAKCFFGGFFFSLLSYFFSPLCPLSLTMLVSMYLRVFYDSSWGRQMRVITENPSYAICGANTDIRAMCGKKLWVFKTLSSFWIGHF